MAEGSLVSPREDGASAGGELEVALLVRCPCLEAKNKGASAILVESALLETLAVSSSSTRVTSPH